MCAAFPFDVAGRLPCILNVTSHQKGKGLGGEREQSGIGSRGSHAVAVRVRFVARSHDEGRKGSDHDEVG